MKSEYLPGDLRIDDIMPILSEEWKTVPFEECLQPKVGDFVKVKQRETKASGQYPVIDQGMDLFNSFVDDVSLLYKGLLPIIIFGDHTRRIKYVDFPFAVGADGTKILKPKPFLDIKFFYYYLLSLNIVSEGYSRHYKFLKTIHVPIPPLSDQHRIVAKLDALFEKIEANKRRLEKIPQILKRFRQSVLADAVSGKLTEGWREQHKIATKHFDNIGEMPLIPNSWNWKKLPELGFLGRGKSRNRPRNAAHLYGGVYPFIQTGDISTSGGRIVSHKQTYSEAGLAQSKQWDSGTVCITIAANIADSAILTYPACFPDSVVGFVANKEESIPEYIEFFFRTIKGDLWNYAPATAQKNINLSILNDVFIATPPIEEQVEIVIIIEKLFNFADTLESRNTKARAMLDKLPQSILGKAFRGELVGGRIQPEDFQP